MVSGAINGMTDHYTVEYQDGVAVIVAAEIARPGGSFEEALNYDVRDLPDPELLPAVLDVMNKGNGALNEVCNGSPEAKQRYRELLDSNLSILGLSPEDYPSDF